MFKKILASLVATATTTAAVWIVWDAVTPTRFPDMKHRDVHTIHQLSYNAHLKEPFLADSYTLQPDPRFMPGTTSPSVFTINDFGFRGRVETISKPADEIRIAFVGGSTTECLYLDDSAEWPRLVCDQVAAVELNCGASGHTTRDNLNTLAHRLVPFQPDVVVILGGWNDLLLQARTRDYSLIRRDSASRRYIDLNQQSQSGKDLDGNVIQDIEGKWLEEARHRRKQLPNGGQLPEMDITEFRQNLLTLIGMSRVHGAVPVLLTQPVRATRHMSESELWACCYVAEHEDHRVEPGCFLDRLEQFNAATRSVASESSCPLVDLASEMNGRPEWFYDLGHFTNMGAAEVARLVSAAVSPYRR